MEKLITKRDLVKKVRKNARRLRESDVEHVIDEFLNAIVDSLKEDCEIYIYNFGRFSMTNFREIEKKLPQGGTVLIPAHKEPKFKFFKSVKDDFVN